MFRLALSLTLALVSATACTTPPAEAPDAFVDRDAARFDGGTDATAIDAAHVDAGPTRPGQTTPLVSRGGAILSHPSIATVTYANDTSRAALDAFADAMIAETDWWRATTSEYGVGPLASLGAVHLDENAPAMTTEDDVAAMLVARANAGTLPRAADGTYDGVIYLVYFPPGVDLRLRDGSHACTEWHGDHDEVRAGDVHLVYAFAADCGANRGFDHIGYLEAAASHELVEAATDPYVESDPAYLAADDSDPWSVFTELTDRCVGQYLSRTGYVLARSWSNAASLANQDPCVPVPDGAIYYGVWTPSTTVHGTAGVTTAIPLTGFARGTTGSFAITAYTAAGPDVPVTFDQPMVSNGMLDVAYLHLPSTPGTSTILFESGPSYGDARNYPVIVIYE